MGKAETIEMVPVIVAGKEVMMPKSLKVGDLKESENLPANRSLVRQRGPKKKVLKDSDEIEVQEEDNFYDIPNWKDGGEIEVLFE